VAIFLVSQRVRLVAPISLTLCLEICDVPIIVTFIFTALYPYPTYFNIEKYLNLLTFNSGYSMRWFIMLKMKKVSETYEEIRELLYPDLLSEEAGCL